MSIVVAVTRNDRTVLAADTLTCFGDTQCVPGSNAATTKLRTIGDVIVGASGWAVYDLILDNHLADQPRPALRNAREIFSFFLGLWKALHEKYPFVNDQSQGKDSPFGDLDSSFLIGSDEGIFKVSHDLDVCRFDHYYAIGTGGDYALGALHALYDRIDDAETLAREAVAAAICFDVHCGGEVTLLTVGA